MHLRSVDLAFDPEIYESDVAPRPKEPPRRVDFPRLVRLGRELLVALGEDPERDGLKDTPQRYARWWREFIEHQPGRMDTSFASASSGQLVAVSGMRVWSLCEHHLLPFWCDVSVGYITGERVLGLSKFARIAHKYAHRLQIQERLVAQIAEEIGTATGSPDVAVMARGEHLCMSMRGVETPAIMSSSEFRGRFKEHTTREEFLSTLRLAGDGRR
ncbi:MAG: GTP cyclohydrolase I [Deltaproteobacteria bacterium]|nr:GTP cyclohydrolase I [Deltaproteobacteria bacterium]